MSSVSIIQINYRLGNLHCLNRSFLYLCRMWKDNVGTLEGDQKTSEEGNEDILGGKDNSNFFVRPRYRSWREMYIQRPRVCLDGCYYQFGWSIFQLNDRLKEYSSCYNYLCFKTDGNCYTFTSDDPPCHAMENLNNDKLLNSKVCCGQYTIESDMVLISFKLSQSPKCKSKNNDFNFRLWIRSSSRIPFQYLCWFPYPNGYGDRSEVSGLNSSSPCIFHFKTSRQSRSKGPLL